MAEEKYVLAMYDIRGKQDYIYRRSKIKEIMGASFIIRDCYIDYLFPAAREAGGEIYSYRVNKRDDKYEYKSDVAEAFSESEFMARMDKGYIGEVVYDGGGNFFILFKNYELYKATNKIFYKKLLENTGTLKVLTTYVEIENLKNYREDEKRLREKHRKAEQEECFIPTVNALPIVQVDPMSSRPLVKRHNLKLDELDDMTLEGKDNKVSQESYAKYEKYREFLNDSKDEKYAEKILDNLITEKGEDSHLAVIYIDGNNMGAKVQKAIDGKSTYEECINALRTLSSEIQRDYIDTPKQAIDKYLAENNKGRFIVYAGDEITFICNAKDAFNLVEIYFENLPDKGQKEKNSCAGVAIFHSHAPYDQAYRIAEECCENGKQLMKSKEIMNVCLMDFHYIQGGIATSIEDIRIHEQGKDYEQICKPWIFAGPEMIDGAESKNDVNRMRVMLQIMARSNSKTLLQAAKSSESVYEREIERIIAHASEKDAKSLDSEFLKKNQALLYRMMLVYDLWFADENSRRETE